MERQVWDREAQTEALHHDKRSVRLPEIDPDVAVVVYVSKMIRTTDAFC